MKKIYIVIAGAFLILLVITTILLSLQKKSATNNQKNSPFPTSIPNTYPQQQGTDPQGINLQQPVTSLQQQVISFDPVETLDFKAAYVQELGKIVVETKSPQAEVMFNQWIDQSQLNEIINNKNKILFTDEKIIPTPSDSIHKLENKVINFFQLMDDLNNIGKGTNNNPSPVTINQTPIPNNPSQNPSSTLNPPSSNYIYYAQCDGPFADVPMNTGCNLCQTGCGPTTAAMVASSYLGSKYDPKTIVDLYRSKGYLLSCSGTRYTDAKLLLQGLGLKTTDFLVFDLEPADQIVSDLKKYMSSGWTFFALANFRDEGPGHFFWITDIDSKNNIWAYDAYYGRFVAPPINENSRYPFPKYRIAFGVKK